MALSASLRACRSRSTKPCGRDSETINAVLLRCSGTGHVVVKPAERQYTTPGKLLLTSTTHADTHSWPKALKSRYIKKFCAFVFCICAECLHRLTL